MANLHSVWPKVATGCRTETYIQQSQASLRGMPTFRRMHAQKLVCCLAWLGHYPCIMQDFPVLIVVLVLCNLLNVSLGSMSTDRCQDTSTVTTTLQFEPRQLDVQGYAETGTKCIHD